MFINSFRTWVTIIVCQALIFSPVIFAEQLALPSGDLIAPEVKHELISKPISAGKAFKFQATVTDNVGIKSVILFYRISGAKNYKRIAMKADANKDHLYSVLIKADDIDAPGLEYYIQAEDLAGNTLLQGHSISPMSAKVTPAKSGPVDSGLAETSEPMQDSGTGGQGLMKNKWLWIGLGVLVGGAALAGGGGGGGNNPGTAGDTTITITAPVP